MKINGVGPSNMINAYNDNKKKITSNTRVEKKDTVEISVEGRSLSSLSMDSNYVSSPSRVEEVKKQISQGTYSPSPKQIAKKMLDVIKGREA